MSGKPVTPREQAHRDVEEGIDYYLIEAGEKTALAFVDALERAYGHIARHPATGSPYYAHELGHSGIEILAAEALSLAGLLRRAR